MSNNFWNFNSSFPSSPSSFSCGWGQQENPISKEEARQLKNRKRHCPGLDPYQPVSQIVEAVGALQNMVFEMKTTLDSTGYVTSNSTPNRKSQNVFPNPKKHCLEETESDDTVPSSTQNQRRILQVNGNSEFRVVKLRAGRHIQIEPMDTTD